MSKIKFEKFSKIKFVLPLIRKMVNIKSIEILPYIEGRIFTIYLVDKVIFKGIQKGYSEQIKNLHYNPYENLTVCLEKNTTADSISAYYEKVASKLHFN